MNLSVNAGICTVMKQGTDNTGSLGQVSAIESAGNFSRYMKRVKVMGPLIVGAGPVGLTAALLLTERSISAGHRQAPGTVTRAS